MSDDLANYIIALVNATRNPAAICPELTSTIRYGASPRATIGLDRAAKAHAWLHGRDYVTPDDIHGIAPDILRHRILLHFSAKADGLTTDDVISQLLHHLALP